MRRSKMNVSDDTALNEIRSKKKKTKVIVSEDKSIDSFSYLPVEIIHRIMFSLSPLDSTRVGALSKHFNSAFRSFPMLDLDCNNLSDEVLKDQKNWPSEFLKFVHNSVRSRDTCNDTLKRLTFRSHRYYWPLIGAEDISRIETAVQLLANFALNHRARELVLDFSTHRVPGLPMAVFSSPSVTTMKLSGLALKPSSGSLVLDSPSLEDFALIDCSFSSPTAMRLSSPKLKAAKFHHCLRVTKIEVESAAAQRLESFSCKKNYNIAAGIEVAGLGYCPALKHLEFEGLNADDSRWFAGDVSAFGPGLEALTLIDCKAVTGVSGVGRHLEALELRGCSSLERIEVVAPSLRHMRLSHVKVSGFVDTTSRFELMESFVMEECNSVEEVVLRSRRLRTVEIRRCRRLRAVEVDALNLVSFDYAGEIFSRPIVLSGDVHAKLSLYHRSGNNNIDQKGLSDFISHLGHSKMLTVVCDPPEMLLFPLEMRLAKISPLYDLRYLNVSFESKVPDFLELVDSLLWLAPHPRTVSIGLGLELYARLGFWFKPCYNEEEEDDELTCCFALAIKCWRHSLVRVELEVCHGFEDESRLRSYFMDNAKAELVLIN